MERTEFEPDVHEEPEHHDDDPPHAEPGIHTGMSLWLAATLFLLWLAFFYVLRS